MDHALNFKHNLAFCSTQAGSCSLNAIVENGEVFYYVDDERYPSAGQAIDVYNEIAERMWNAPAGALKRARQL